MIKKLCSNPVSTATVNIWVSSGSLNTPFYRFYTDSSGTSELQQLIFDHSKSYTFRRLNEASSHPFYLKSDRSNSGGTNGYSLSGEGSPSNGIKGDESFTLSFNDPNQAPAMLVGYCTMHPSMQTTWSINLSPQPEPEPTPTPEPEPTPTPEPEPTPTPQPEPTPTPQPEPTPTPEPENYEPPVAQNQIKGSKKDDDLNGTRKSDQIVGKKGNDTLTGRKGDDLLKGGSGQDVLIGSNGQDYLDGSKGIDILNGGKGADVFQISKGIDLVEDFSIKQGDKIALDKKGTFKIVDDPDGVLIVANAKKQLFLEGVEYDDAIAAGIDLFVQPA